MPARASERVPVVVISTATPDVAFMLKPESVLPNSAATLANVYEFAPPTCRPIDPAAPAVTVPVALACVPVNSRIPSCTVVLPE